MVQVQGMISFLFVVLSKIRLGEGSLCVSVYQRRVCKVKKV